MTRVTRWGTSSKRRGAIPKRLTPEERLVLDRAIARQERWASIRSDVFERADYRCEVALDGVRCRRRAVDGHHVLARSQGGQDVPDNVVAVCRFHQEAVDWPDKRGRLEIASLGGERFTYAIVTAA